MIFKEDFTKGNDIWHFGEKNFHANPGPMFLHEKWVWPTLSVSPLPTAINPRAYDSCTIGIRFHFGENVTSGKAMFVMFKKYMYSSEAEAPVKIYISPSGEVEICFYDKPQTKGRLSKEDAGFSIEIVWRGGTLSIVERGETIVSCALTDADSLHGYFAFSHIDEAKYYVDNFEFDSDVDAKPYTAAEFEAEKVAFFNECADYAERRAAEVLEYQSRHPNKREERCDIEITPSLAHIGEEITIVLKYRGDKYTNSAVVLYKDCFKQGEYESLKLEFAPDRDGNYTAEYRLVPEKAGNLKVVWYCNGQRISRIFGVADNDSTVVNFWVGSHNAELYKNLLKRYDLPGDYHVLDNGHCIFGYNDAEYADMLKIHADGHYYSGDSISPFINGANIIIKDSPDFNLFDVPFEVQRRIIAALKQLWRAFGVGELQNIGCYTHGANTIRACEQNGIYSIDSMCVWQNTEDFGWNINHIGAPVVPYFTSYEDFRKVGNRPVIMSSMGTATSVRSYDIYSYDGSPSNLSPTQRYADQMAQHFAIERFCSFFDQFVDASSDFDSPVFFTAAIENFTGKADWDMANELAVNYIVERASERNIVFSRKIDIAEYYRRRFTAQPRTVFFETDTSCGVKCSAKPSRVPDRIEYSDSRTHCLFHENISLPVCFWDYTDKWEALAWQTFSNRRNNAMPPDEILFDEASPRFKDTRGVKVKTRRRAVSGGVKISVNITSDRSFRYLPIAVWNITPSRFENIYTKKYSLEICRDNVNNNSHAVLTLFDVERGETELSVFIECEAGECAMTQCHIGGDVYAKEMKYADTRYLLLYAENSPGEPRKIRIFCRDKNALVKFSDGSTIHASDCERGEVQFLLNTDWKNESVFLFNISAAEIELIYD